MKICNKCGIQKELSDFNRHSNHTDGRTSHCRDCIKAYKHTDAYRTQALIAQRKWRQNPKNAIKVKRWSKKFRESEYGKAWIKDDMLKRTRGIDLKQYNKMLAQQNHCCAICLKHESNFTKMLHVDHDHSTGDIRALLCHYCNAGLGHFHDDINLLCDALEYLKKHKKFKLIVGDR